MLQNLISKGLGICNIILYRNVSLRIEEGFQVWCGHPSKRRKGCPKLMGHGNSFAELPEDLS
jgi:hypothetical protein